MDKSLVLFILLLLSGVSCTEDQTGVVETDKGKLRGKPTASGVMQFLGVPYAKKPTGDLRWKKPQAMDPWNSIHDATEYAKSAIQTSNTRDLNYFDTPTSEDCLYLNIWTANTNRDTLRPVLILLHEGGFALGSGAQANINGKAVAEKGIVVVTLNYRLNIFGFLSHPQLSRENSEGVSGNYGLYDQQFALEWIQRNIDKFGGDPENITLAGSSAGAMSINVHQCNAGKKNLFHKVIMTSGSLVKPLKTLEKKEKLDSMNLSKLGHDNIRSLRKLSADSLLRLFSEINPLYFGPVVDDNILHGQISDLYESNKCADVPVVIGWTSHEIPGPVLFNPLKYNKRNFRQICKKRFPNNYKDVLKIFPHKSMLQLDKSSTEIASMLAFSYQSWKIFDLHRENHKSEIYRFLFKKTPPVSMNDTIYGSYPDHKPGPIHASDVPYAWLNLDKFQNNEYDEKDHKVSEKFNEFLIEFIKNGNPNGDQETRWNASNQNCNYLVVDTSFHVVSCSLENKFLLFDEIFN